MHIVHPQAPAHDVDDAQRVAGWAAEAFLEGRFELGAALSRIALQAHRMTLSAPVRVPFMGATRVEQPRPVETPAFDAVARAETAIMARTEVTGDAYAPSKAGWRLVDEGEWQTSRSGIRYRFLGYER